MKAVVTSTPEPKYLAMKKAQAGTPMPFRLAAKTGNHVPKKLPTRMTKMEEILVPMRPSYSLPGSHVDMIAAFRSRVSRVSVLWYRKCPKSCRYRRPGFRCAQLDKVA